MTDIRICKHYTCLTELCYSYAVRSTCRHSQTSETRTVPNIYWRLTHRALARCV